MRKYNGLSNISGRIIAKYRQLRGFSREELATRLQLIGINIDRTSILRIEQNKVILKDFEFIAICIILNINYKEIENEMNLKQI